MKNLVSRGSGSLVKYLGHFIIGFLFLIPFSPIPGLADPASSVTLTPGEDGVQRVTILMESYSFSPSDMIVQADKPISIRLENHSFLIPHNFVIDNPAMGFHYEMDISAGDAVNFQLLLTTPGIYTFYCDKQLLFFPSHRKEGMEGTLEVR